MKQDIQRYKSMKTIGYWSALGGIEIKDIEYGIEDYMVCLTGAWCSAPSVHRVKINTNGNRQYILLNGSRFYLDEAVRS